MDPNLLLMLPYIKYCYYYVREYHKFDKLGAYTLAACKLELLVDVFAPDATIELMAGAVSA